MTIPATVPLASRLLCDGAGVPTAGCLGGLLLVKALWLVLGLVLLGWGTTGSESSFVVDPGLGVGAAEEVTPSGIGVVLGVGELAEALPTPEGAELEAEVELGVLPPGAVTRPPHEVNVEPSGE